MSQISPELTSQSLPPDKVIAARATAEKGEASNAASDGRQGRLDTAQAQASEPAEAGTQGDVIVEGHLDRIAKAEKEAGQGGEADEVAPEMEGEVIKEAYFSLNTVMWKWSPALPDWQKNAVIGMTTSDALVSPEHPLRLPEDEGVRFYLVVDKDGREKLCLSLAQMEYIQYYIHDMRMADPVWVMHVAAMKEAQSEKERAEIQAKGVGPAQYPPGEEWVRLPGDLILREDIASITPTFCDDSRKLKKDVSRYSKQNKRVNVELYKMRPCMTEKDDELEAIIDNETPGPGLRRGPERQRDYKPWGSDENPRASPDERKVAPEFVPESAEQTVANLSEQLQSLETFDIVTETEAPVATDAAEDISVITDNKPKAPPLPTGNFTTQYFQHALNALQIATLGGFFASNFLLDKDPTKEKAEQVLDAPPIGRSLFISIRLVTWEVDPEVVLELGYSAIWWQKINEEWVKGKDLHEELRESGHFVIVDHAQNKRNGVFVRDERDNFLYGQTLPIAQKDIKQTIESKIKDLTERAGGGPVYLIKHSADRTASDLSKLGISTADHYTQFKPSSWQYPSYACVDGIGKIFEIDTAIMLAAVEFEPTVVPSPIKTQRILAEVVSLMKRSDEDSGGIIVGNAGNDAWYCLQIAFIELVTTGLPLDALRADFKKAFSPPDDEENTAAGAVEPTELDKEVNQVEALDGESVHGSAGNPDGAKAEEVDDGASDKDSERSSEEQPQELEVNEDEEDWSEDEGIIGVYALDDDGNEVKLP